MKKKWLSMIKLLPFALCIIFILCYLAFNEKISVQTIIEYTPNNSFGAALILLLMYAAKSVSIFFPLIILEIVGGHLFSTLPAIIINSIGILICHIIAYWMGHFSGTTAIERLVQKHSSLESIMRKQNSNSFFMCFFLRNLYCLPGDVVSMYLGATRTPFGRYIIASSLGSLPRTILATLFGSSITEPSSPMFWVSILLMTLFAVVSSLTYYIYKHKIQK